MLVALISMLLFGTLYYFLWAAWCRHAPKFLSPTTPSWVMRPNFFLFFFVTLLVLLFYKNLSRK